ncbi:MAG: arsenite methyltransferase [Anaerolineales bacterium]|jgi:ubiquinone/menaquinone biosynthesis C-methylase UbiE|nr:arsenite methyltransferase [Anaerolineales bacterium]
MNDTHPSADYFARIAGEWDRLRAGYFTEGVRETAIAKAYLHPSMVVADVGAGTGFMAAGLAPKVRLVYVVDASAEMLAVARQNLASFENITYHIADGLSLPLPDASLDAVIANMYLHHCSDPLAALREIVRTLRPGGRLVITDMDAHPYPWLQTEMADIWLGFERSQIRSWFEQTGLVNIVVDCTGEHCQAGCQCEAGEQAQISIFVAAGTKRMEVHASVQASYAAQASGEGCGCADPGCCAPDLVSLDAIDTMVWDGGYSLAEKAEIPEEAALISLGCGNPLAMAGLKPGETVLDIGSGGGIDVFLAAKRVGPEGAVIGVDMTPAMLQRARRAAKNGGYTNVKFRHGYAEKLPVPDASIDVVISNCVINLTEDKGKVFREVFRVLKQGGRLEVNDVVFGGAVPPALRSSMTEWAGCIAGALPEQEYLDLVRQAGFREVQARRSTSHGISNGVPVYSVQVSARK